MSSIPLMLLIIEVRFWQVLGLDKAGMDGGDERSKHQMSQQEPTYAYRPSPYVTNEYDVQGKQQEGSRGERIKLKY